MKKIFFISFATLLLNFLVSCTPDDDSATDLAGTNNVELKFDHGFEGIGKIALNTTTQTSKNGQKHQFSTLKYIISNITLIDENNKSFQYFVNDPNNGAFIVDLAKSTNSIFAINLKDVPSANYKKIRFGLGIDPNSYLLGQDKQATFIQKAQEAEMFWSWTSGYIFTKLEGKYGTDLKESFMNYVGNKGDISKNGTPNVYREITLDFPESAKVRQSIAPSVHLKVNMNHFLSGKNSLTLDTTTDNQHGSSEYLVKVADNTSEMFSVDHIHND